MFSYDEGVVLGHHISKDRIRVDPKKVEIINEIIVPKNQIDVRSFYGHVGYYIRFIEGFNKNIEPLFTLIKKGPLNLIG